MDVLSAVTFRIAPDLAAILVNGTPSERIIVGAIGDHLSRDATEYARLIVTVVVGVFPSGIASAAAGMENVKASNKALRAKKRAAKRVANKKEWEESDEEKESEPEDEDQLDEKK
jgi:hypothetical protein